MIGHLYLNKITAMPQERFKYTTSQAAGTRARSRPDSQYVLFGIEKE